MKIDIGFYLGGDIENRVSQLMASSSPLKISEKEHPFDFYMFKSKNSILSGLFIYGQNLESEKTSEDRLHIETQKRLEFNVNSSLTYGSCNISKEKIGEFMIINDFLNDNNVPNYLTITDEDGYEHLISGFNPLNNTRIKNTISMSLCELLRK